ACEERDEGPAEDEPSGLAREMEASGGQQDRERGMVEIAEAWMMRAGEIVGFPVAEARPGAGGESEAGAQGDEPDRRCLGGQPARATGARGHVWRSVARDPLGAAPLTK